jgi:hypothetical protein
MSFPSRAKNWLEWMQLAKFVADLIVTVGSWKLVKKALTYSSHVSADWASVLALFVAAAVLFLLVRWQERRLARRELSPSSSESVPQILTPLNHWEVGLRRTVAGTVHSPDSRVQVLVLAGDGRWYLQGPRGQARVDGLMWSVECQFGNAELGVGSNYQIIAITNGNIRDTQMSALPNEGLRSEIVRVRRTS